MDSIPAPQTGSAPAAKPLPALPAEEARNVRAGEFLVWMHEQHRRSYVYAPQRGKLQAGWYRSMAAAVGGKLQPVQQKIRPSLSGLDRYFTATQEQLEARVAGLAAMRRAAVVADAGMPPRPDSGGTQYGEEWHGPQAMDGRVDPFKGRGG